MMLPGFVRRQGWTSAHAAGAVALVAVSLLLTRDAWLDIYQIISKDEQSHVFLVPIVSVWMFWARRFRLRNCPPSGTLIGPVIVALGWAMWTIGYDHGMQSVWHAGAVAITVGAALTVLGKNVLFRFFPAIAVVVFLVPIPSLIRQGVSLPLQTASAAATGAILETCGFAAERSGNVLTLNGVGVEVAEACNGMRMVFALLLVSYAFAFGMPLRNPVRALVLLASPVAAILCNVVRLIPTVLLFGYASHSIANTFHDISGWLMVPLAFMILLGVMRVLRWALIPVSRYTLAYQ
jgi:exosortase